LELQPNPFPLQITRRLEHAALIAHGSVHICEEGQNKVEICAVLSGLMNELGMVWLAFPNEWDGVGTALGRPCWPSLLVDRGAAADHKHGCVLA